MLKSINNSSLKFWQSSSTRATTGPKNSTSSYRPTDRATLSSSSTKNDEKLPTQAGWGTLGAMAGLALGFVGGAMTGIVGLSLFAGAGLAVAGGYGAMKLADKIQGIDRPPLTPEQERARTKRLNDYIDRETKRQMMDDWLFAP